MTYDGRGNEVREDYFDEKGGPTRNKDGYATLAFAYGAGGKEIERTFFDEAGKPTPNTEGYARLTIAVPTWMNYGKGLGVWRHNPSQKESSHMRLRTAIKPIRI
jgi:hypothetical protein